MAGNPSCEDGTFMGVVAVFHGETIALGARQGVEGVREGCPWYSVKLSSVNQGLKCWGS